MSPEQWTEEDLNEPREAVATSPADAGTPPSAPEPSQADTEAHSDERVGSCRHEHVRTFRSVPSHSKCLDCGRVVEKRWVSAVADAEQAELRASTGAEITRLERALAVADETWHEAERALADERAKVARVEALIANWEAAKGTPESGAWARYIAERVRNALSGDYSSEATQGGDR